MTKRSALSISIIERINGDTMNNCNYVISSIIILSIAVIVLTLLLVTSFDENLALPLVCIFIFSAPVLIAVSSIPPVVNYIQNNKRETYWNTQNDNQGTAAFLKSILTFTIIMTIGFPCFTLLSNSQELKRYILILMATACLLQILTNLYMYIKTRLLSFAIAFITNVLAVIIFFASAIIFIAWVLYALCQAH